MENLEILGAMKHGENGLFFILVKLVQKNGTMVWYRELGVGFFTGKISPISHYVFLGYTRNDLFPRFNYCTYEFHEGDLELPTVGEVFND